MPRLSVEVDLPEITPEELRAAVVREVANRVLGLSSPEEDTNPDIGIFASMRQVAREEITQSVKKVVQARIPQVVDEELHREFQPMTAWGDKEGPPTTIRTMIGTYAKSWLTEVVDSSGRPGYSDGRKQPRLHWAIQQEVDRAWKEHLARFATEAAQTIKAELAGKLTQEVGVTVRRLLGL